MAEAVGLRLQAVRRFYGWSQRELAKRAGIPNSAVSVIEKGSVSPSVTSLEKILKGFPMNMADFFSINMARQSCNVSCLDADPESEVLSSQFSGRQESAGISLKTFSCRNDEQSLSVMTRTKTLLMVIAGEVIFHSIGLEQNLRLGNSVSIDSPTPYRVEALTPEAIWVVASIP